MSKTGESPDLVFVHLSDVHFRKSRVGDIHDEDAELRNELQLDLRRLRAEVSRFDGLIVSGDIAFGGQKEEYDYARSWFESIGELLGCAPGGIMVTPGNHDVDRARIPEDGEIDRLHCKIREARSLEERDEVLASVLRDSTTSALMFEPVAAYNAFAEGYGCRVSPMMPYWERNFSLGDGSELRFRGLTTTLISGPRDDEQAHKALYGGAQRSFLRESNVRYVVVGHHPPSWTLEGDVADRVFSVRTVLQLFGHKHDHWVTRLGNGVRLIAGAMHPDRREPRWLPRYSLITITVADEGRLSIRVYPRRWSTEEIEFIPDYNSAGCDYRDFSAEVVSFPANILGSTSGVPPLDDTSAETWDARGLAIRLDQLGPELQLYIAVSLSLCAPGTDQIESTEIVKIASCSGRIDELRRAIMRHLSRAVEN